MRSSRVDTLRILKRATLLPAILAMGLQLWAQVPSGANAQDPFGQVHAALDSTADSLLAAATVQRLVGVPVGGVTSDKRAESADARDSRRAVSQPQSWQRVQQLRPLIDPILRQEGVPTELAAVALIESGGQPAALSPKGARRIWQFMSDTARRYGLAVDPRNDERLDLLKSTRAAARYLHNLHDRFDSWPLALAAYNAGEDAVQRAIDRTGRSDFVGLRRSLPPETRNYVHAVIAAARGFGNQSLFRIPGIRQSKPPLVVYASADERNQRGRTAGSIFFPVEVAASGSRQRYETHENHAEGGWA